MFFYTHVENRLGFRRCYALFRDQARKRAFYGDLVEIKPAEISYSRIEGDIFIKIDEENIHLSMNISPKFIHKREELLALFLKPSSNLTNSNFKAIPCKIFGTGLSRTGTTSLSKALEILGIFNIHHAPYMYSGLAFNSTDLTTIPEYSAFIDSPFSYFYKQLDVAYPGSKFIHTQRDPELWVDSMEWLLSGKSTPASRWFYGTPDFNRQIYISKYMQHYEEVVDYFKKRKSDLLILELGAEDSWFRICGFLGMSMPDSDYPNLNKNLGYSSLMMNEIF